MAKQPNPLVEKIIEMLSPHGPISWRAMFGGYGIYFDGVMMASIYQDTLYFRVDEINRGDFIAYGSRPFTYDGFDKPIELPYMTLPDEIWNNPKQLKEWIVNSYHAAARQQAKKKKYPKKKKKQNRQ